MAYNKKAQEEMVGFVIIVVMFIVMGLLLMFMIRPTQTIKKDLQTGNLLETLLESTEEGRPIRVIIESCAEGTASDCEVAKNASIKRLDAALVQQDIIVNRTINGYSFEATSEGFTRINITNGTLMGNKITGLIPLQNIDVILRFYY